MRRRLVDVSRPMEHQATLAQLSAIVRVDDHGIAKLERSPGCPQNNTGRA
jgi:hypothetical protein